MNKEFSAGAVIFKRKGPEISFLIVYSNRNKTWGFPKGRIEKGETEKNAAIREIKEETGLDNLRFIDGFTEKIMYETISKRSHFEGEEIEKYVTYFLCGTKDQDIIVDAREITDYKFLPLKEAGRLVRFPNLERVLKRAYDFLQAM